jgi:hypothetical protein
LNLVRRDRRVLIKPADDGTLLVAKNGQKWSEKHVFGAFSRWVILELGLLSNGKFL